jgi:hypothetical protein
MAFAVATCPKCEKRFRLLWRIGKRKLDLQQGLKLTCPSCGAVFKEVCVKLPTFSAGKEAFPLTATVDESCLLNRS